MSSNRFNNTLSSVRQHNYQNEENDDFFKGPFREETGSKIYFSIKPTDKIKKSKPQTTSRASRKRSSGAISSNKRRKRNLSRYANGIKMNEPKKNYSFKRQQESGNMFREEFRRDNSGKFKDRKMMDRAPNFIDNNDFQGGRLQKFFNRSKSALKKGELLADAGQLDHERFTQTMQNRKKYENSTTEIENPYSRFEQFSHRAENNKRDWEVKKYDDKSPYKKYRNESGAQNIFNKRTPIKEEQETFNNKFYLPSFLKTGKRSNNSMISSRSYEVMEPNGKGKENRDFNKDSSKSKSRAKIRNIMLNSKTTRESAMPNRRTTTTSKKSQNLFFDFSSRCNNTMNNATTPDDSYIFKQANDPRNTFNYTMDYRRGYNMSPAISTRRRDKSRVSALDRSDISMRSRVSNANSFITKRDGSNPASRIKGVPCDSKLKNMSKTWVRSNLLESREDISTLKYKKNSNIDLSHSAHKAKSKSQSKSKSMRKSRSIHKKKKRSKDSKGKKKNRSKKKLELDKLFIITDDNSNRDIRANEYELKKSIGQGAYAKVYKAVHLPTGAKVAIKLYQKSKLKDKLRQKSIKREIKILSKIHHENIVNFIDCFSTNNHIYLVMELVEGLSLYELLKKQPKRRISEENARSIIKQILRALNYCHSRNVTHRDIKLENVIVSNEGVVKIIDFGFSTCIPNEKKVRMFCGTPSYMAPEIVKKIEYRGPPVDIWATGVLFYVLLSGKFPFRGSTDKKLYYRISYSEIKFRSSIREKVCTVINHMMSKNAEDRPTCKELLEGYFCSRKYILKQAQKERKIDKSEKKSKPVLDDVTNELKMKKNTSNNKMDSTNQFNKLLKKLDHEYKGMKSGKKENKYSYNEKREKSTKRIEREKILSKYLNKSKTSYRPRSPQTTRNEANEGIYTQRSANRAKNPSYIYFERSRRMLENKNNERTPQGYNKGDFTKFLENGKLPY